MPKWKKFEVECAGYLNKEYETKETKFILQGSTDSNVGDILVIKENKGLFYVEVKSELSQAGQFVVIKNRGNWIFGEANKSNPTINAQKIIEYLNTDNMNAITTTGTVVDIDKHIQYEWIKDFYKQRDVSFFITNYNNKKVILPIDKIEDYFNISVLVRKKGSGSGEVSKPFWNKIKNHTVFLDYKTQEIRDKKRYLYFDNLPNSLTEEKTKFQDEVDGELIRFQVQKVNENKVYIRKLSTTSNPTVIFSLESKQYQNSEDLNLFESLIK